MNTNKVHLTAEEKTYLTEYRDKEGDIETNLEISKKVVDLVRKASIESLCEVVISNSFDICPLIASYLNDSAEELGFAKAVAVEKMARVKRAPWALNQFRLSPEERVFIESVQTEVIERALKQAMSEY